MDAGAGPKLPGERGSLEPRPAWLILALILHGLVYSLLLPPWMGEDEPWHLEYAWDLALARESSSEAEPGPEPLSPSQARVRERTGASTHDVVGTQAQIVASMRKHHVWQRVDFAGWEHGAVNLDHIVVEHTEAHQPKLYYALCALGLRALGIQDVERGLWFLRALSFLAYLAVSYFTYALARMVTKDAWLAVGATLVVAWLPMHAHQAATVSNDVLVKVFTGAALWLLGLALLGRGGLALYLATTACTGLALATKPTAVGLAGPLCFVVAWLLGRGRTPLVSLLAGLGAGIVLAGGAFAYWRFVGPEARAPLDGMAVPGSLVDLRPHLAWVLSFEFRRETMRTFVGVFNWYMRELPPGAYAAVMIALGASLLASLAVLVRGPAELQRRILVLCWIAVLCQLLAMATRGFAAGRFLFPMLPALGTLVAAGWIAPFPPRWRARIAGLLAAALILYDGFVLWTGLFPNQYLIWGS